MNKVNIVLNLEALIIKAYFAQLLLHVFKFPYGIC